MYSAREVSKLVGVHYNTVKNWIKSETLIPDDVVYYNNAKRYYFTKETISKITLRLKTGL